MAGFLCPFCNCSIAFTAVTFQEYTMSPFYCNTSLSPPADGQTKIKFYTCPDCGEITITADVEYDSSMETVHIRPQAIYKHFPSYVPEPIRKDYEEACAILKLSPKASATLSRRCLQGMIRDFWSIKESNLSKAINQLEGKVPAQQWRVIDSLRRLGNIGAHMEKDINLIVEIDPNEAQKLVKLIELLIEQWYINRWEQEKLYSEIIEIDNAKQEIRKKSE